MLPCFARISSSPTTTTSTAMNPRSGFSSDIGSSSFGQDDRTSTFGDYPPSTSSGNDYHFPSVHPGINPVGHTNPRTSTSAHPAQMTSDWQHNQHTLTNPTPIPPHSMDLSLGQLLVYPVVQNLHKNWAEASLRVSLALETQAALVKENLRLSNELREANRYIS